MAEDFSLERLSGVQKQDMAEFTKSQASAEESVSLFSKDALSAGMVDSFSHVEDVEDVAEISEESFEVEETGNKKQSGGGVTAVANMIRKAVARHSDVDIKDVDVNYWAEIIYNISSTYKVPAGLIVAIMEQEDNGKFRKNLTGGPMQLRNDTIKDFVADSNRIKAYKVVDNKLRQSIISSGNNSTGVSTYMALAKKNGQLGIMMGVLAFKMKLMSAVIDIAKKDLGIKFSNPLKVGYHGICEEAKTMLKNGKIKFTEAQAKKVVRLALERYNVGNTAEYLKNVPKSLESFGVSYSSIINILINNN